jgi:phage shock protein A
MGFFGSMFTRSTRVVKGQMNTAMDSIEDVTFESTLKQTVRDLKEELNNMVRTSADAMSSHNRLEAEYQKYVRQSDEWKERAKKALKADNEELAKKALAQKSEADRQVASMQISIDQARETSEKLKQGVAEVRRKIAEAERNASTLIARKNAAKAQKKVAMALAGVADTDNAFAAINAFEESVARDEAQAQAFESMAGSPDKDLEAEFAELQTSEVDDELESLRREMSQ